MLDAHDVPVGEGRGRGGVPGTQRVQDLHVLAHLIPERGYLHGDKPTSIDASIYGFIANIYFYDIDTPLKKFVVAQENIARHCRAIHEAVGGNATG